MERDYQGIIEAFLISYTKNDVDKLYELLSEDVTIDYSNLGRVQGIDNVIKKLSWEENFDITRVTITNELFYNDNSKITFGLIAHHLVAYEKNNELFPLVFGGKYVIEIDDNKIRKVSFLLEYQNGNTIYVKGKWKLAQNHKDYSIVNEFNLEKVYQKSISEKNYIDLVKLFFWCLDTKNLSFAKQMITTDFSIKRPFTVGKGMISGTYDTLEKYVDEDDAYYDLNQYSLKFNNIDEKDTIVQISAQHLTPHRTGTKKLNSLTKYSSFFDEDVSIELIKSKEKILIHKINIIKGSDVANIFNEIVRY